MVIVPDSVSPMREQRKGDYLVTKTVDTVVIGAGQAGLSISYYLTQQGRDHIVLEKSRVGES